MSQTLRTLSNVIRANGVFSATSGLVLSIGSTALDEWIGVGTPWLIASGVSLVGYGVWLYASSRRPQTLASVGRLATAADLAWVVGALALITTTDLLSRNGEIALGAASAFVLLFAVEQLIALKKLAKLSMARTA